MNLSLTSHSTSNDSNSASGFCQKTQFRVVLRLRPLDPRENDDEKCVTKLSNDEVQFVRGSDSLVYAFDSVFSETTTQKELFASEVEPVLKAFLEGINVTVFCYGITGSGKTHTMQGTKADPGMTPQAVSKILEMLQQNKNPQIKYSLQMSYFEIYNDKIFDLLSENGSQNPLPMREVAQRIIIQNLSQTPITSLADFTKAYSFGIKKRQVGQTGLNQNSSRSHGLLRLSLHLIDLAGSEDNRRTNNVGTRMTESAAINTSLFVLAQVVEGLKRGDTSIPFRQSCLTRVLQDSLRHANCLMIANIAPDRAHDLQTKRTLEFASSSRQVITVTPNEACSTRIPKVPTQINFESSSEEVSQRLRKMERRSFEISTQAKEIGVADRLNFVAKLHGIETTIYDSKPEKSETWDPQLMTPKNKIAAARLEIRRGKELKEIDPKQTLSHFKQAYLLCPESKKLGSKIESLEKRLSEEEKETETEIVRLILHEEKKDF